MWVTEVCRRHTGKNDSYNVLSNSVESDSMLRYNRINLIGCAEAYGGVRHVCRGVWASQTWKCVMKLILVNLIITIQICIFWDHTNSEVFNSGSFIHNSQKKKKLAAFIWQSSCIKYFISLEVKAISPQNAMHCISCVEGLTIEL